MVKNAEIWGFLVMQQVKDPAVVTTGTQVAAVAHVWSLAWNMDGQREKKKKNAAEIYLIAGIECWNW